MEIRNLNQLLSNAAKKYDKPDALLYKKKGEWRRISSRELIEKAGNLALGLNGLGIGRGDKVTLLSENRHEWFIIDASLQILGTVNVPIYATLPPPQITYIVSNSESKVVIASTADQQKKIAAIRSDLPSVGHYITIDPPTDGYQALTLDEVMKQGQESRRAKPDLVGELSDAVDSDDLASIIYTSGTTGDPKGVMLTHRNLLSNVAASQKALPVEDTDVALSVLPYSHVFERLVAHYLYANGGATVALADGQEKLLENLGEIRPTIMTMVPRFYEKVYAGVMEKSRCGERAEAGRPFNWAVAIGREHGKYRQRGEPAPALLNVKYALASRLAFAKLHARVGGRLRFFISGAAPLAREIAEFFWAAGLQILEGYGLTETSPVISVNRPDAFKFGTVGQPVEGVEVRIAKDGEILVRGPNVMKGYYKNEAATREAIDEDDFFHTGDVGVLDSDGFLAITDRKKDLIVTAGGKNIAPQPIEGRVKTNAYIAEFVLVGNKRKFPAAIVVPDFEKLDAWCKEQSIDASDRNSMTGHPDVIAFMESQVQSMTSHLAQFEKIKKITLIATEFTLEGGGADTDAQGETKGYRGPLQGRHRSDVRVTMSGYETVIGLELHAQDRDQAFLQVPHALQ